MQLVLQRKGKAITGTGEIRHNHAQPLRRVGRQLLSHPFGQRLTFGLRIGVGLHLHVIADHNQTGWQIRNRHAALAQGFLETGFERAITVKTSELNFERNLQLTVLNQANYGQLLTKQIDPLPCLATPQKFALPDKKKPGFITATFTGKGQIPLPHQGMRFASRGRHALYIKQRGIARRFATGIFMIWYPVKGDDFAEQICAAFQNLVIPAMLKAKQRT